MTHQPSHPRRAHRTRAGVLAVATVLCMLALSLVAAPARALDEECVQDGLTVTCTYTVPGLHTPPIPADVLTVFVEAYGGHGSDGLGGLSGRGARVGGYVDLPPGADEISVLVARNGAPGTAPAYAPPAWAGGGGCGSGGGFSGFFWYDDAVGAVWEAIAAGGGGAGCEGGLAPSLEDAGPGGDAGQAGTAGGNGNAGAGGGGGPGTASAGGAGGSGGSFGGFPGGSSGSAGSALTGGAAGRSIPAGGGGGAGWYGGGGGGSGTDTGFAFGRTGGGGGGGGSSLVPASGGFSGFNTDPAPRVVVSWTATEPPPPPAGASLSPSSVDFGSRTIGATSAPQTVTLTSTGESPLVVDGVALTGANRDDFAIADDGCTGASVQPDDACQVQVTFTPTAEGPREAALEFTDNAAGSPRTVPLAGNGVAESADLGVNLSAAPNPVKSGNTLRYTIGVRNNGPDPASQVTLVDIPPTASQFDGIVSLPGDWSCDTPAPGSTGTITCTTGMLPSGYSDTIVFEVTVVAASKTTVTNTAEISSDSGDPNLRNNQASVTTSVKGGK